MTIQNINQKVETLFGGQRQGVAFGSKVVILDKPMAALGVQDGRRALDLIREARARGAPIILISPNTPHVFEVADRAHARRLDPNDISISDAAALMTGATTPDEAGLTA